MKGKIMKTNDEADFTDELRPEYHPKQLTGRVQGEYTERYRAGTNIVRLAPDVAAAFLNEEAVNHALRLLIQVAKAGVP
jgi:hypothetical protein